MTIQIINTGSGANSRDGDSIRAAFTKVNNNFVGIVETLSTITGSTTGTSITQVSAVPPQYPTEGMLWYDATDGRLYIYFDSFWIDSNPNDPVAGYAGSRGVPGYAGSSGYTGSASTVPGYTGSQGVGYTGSQGSNGNIGYTGSQGAPGAAAWIGYTGSRGAGYTGSAGTGYTGSASTAVGYTGSIGNIGYTGSASTAVGYTGSIGDIGYTGSQGDIGYTGSQGPDADQPLNTFNDVEFVSVKINQHLTLSSTLVDSLTIANTLTDVRYAYIGDNNISIGPGAGQNTQTLYALAIGINAGQNSQGESAVAIGGTAGLDNQGINAIAIGTVAAHLSQGESSIAIGTRAGENTQTNFAIAIGNGAGKNSQGESTVAIGNGAGENTQTNFAIAVGISAGRYSQGESTVAIGNGAGRNDQTSFSVGVGFDAGRTSQGYASIAVGASAGKTTQGIRSTAIGVQAGNDGQGNYAVALGYKAGWINQHANSIVINATTSSLNGDAEAGLYIDPVRSSTPTDIVVYYNTSTKELTYGAPVITIAGDTPPSLPSNGTTWYDSTSGRLYIYFDNTWVDASPAGGSSYRPLIPYQVISPPASSTSTGIAGQVSSDATYMFVCVNTNTWVRSALVAGW